jgi:tetratricopeptide (TPR) repeat protein
MDEHGTPSEEEDELEDELSPERLKEMVRRAVRGDAASQAAFHKLLPPAEPPEDAPLSPELSVAYDAALDQVEDFVRRAQTLPSTRERLEFRKALNLLKPGEDVRALVKKGDMPVAGLGTFEALLARSWAARYDNPQLMLHLARVALSAARSIDPERYGEQQVADHQARAWTELGNAYRVNERFEEAASALKTADELLERGTGDSALQTRVLELQASLLGSKREWVAALPSLSVLPRLYRKLGQPQLAGRALIMSALYTYYSGQAEKAIRINEEAISLIDPDQEPKLIALAMKNQMLYLTDCGQFEAAWRILFEYRSQFQALGKVPALRARAIEGRINYGLKKLISAELIFRELKGEFAALELRFGSALATLEVAMVLMAQNRIDEAEKEVLDAIPIFKALNAQPEIYSCVIILEEAFRLREADLELLEGTVRFLRKKQIEHGIRL